MSVNIDNVVTIEHLINMYNIIKKNTKHKEKLLNFEMYFTANIVSIYNDLINNNYKHSRYNIFLITEPKQRIVMSECIKDKIVNHLISYYVLTPLIEPKLIYSNTATRINKVTKVANNLCIKYLNKIKEINNFYILKCDISKYFYNIEFKLISY